MASKEPAIDDEILVNLTECGICLSEMENPKALPCLHSFCLKCLNKVKHPPGIITCPLCQEEITMPTEGINGLRDDFFIKQLKDWKAIQNIGKVKTPCVCCKSTDQDTSARCKDCSGFLCQQCVSLHRTITPLAGHKIFSIDELRSGQIEMIKEESCQTHKDQVLKWFCKTCNIPICCECAVMDHARPDHNYITIDSASERHTKEIKTLMSNCKGRLKDTIDDTEEATNNFKKAVDNVKKELEEERKSFIEAIHRSYDENMEMLAQIQKEQMEKLHSTRKSIEFTQTKLYNAIKIANVVIKYGSKYNVASDYSTLCKTLLKLHDSYPHGISKSIDIVEFNPSQRGKQKTVDIGSVSKVNTRVNTHRPRNGRWVFTAGIGRQGQTKCGNGIAVGPNKSILVADNWDASIKVFDQDGNLEHIISNYLKHPKDIALSLSGFYVADESPYIKSFKHKGDFIMQFPAISPDEKTSYTDGSKLYGIATNNDGNILVGNYNKQYISKHRPDGTHISSFPTHGIKPCFLKVTANGSIVVTSDKYGEPAYIMDPNGNHLHTINRPNYAKGWHPSGITCSDDGNIFIANLNRNDGIYSFTEHGEYQECVIDGVCRPTGLDIYDDMLVVAQWNGLPGKIYTFKYENNAS